MGYSVCF